MAKLTKTEQETIITFNKGEKTATVFTYDKRIQDKMKAHGVKATEKNGLGGNTYILPSKKMVRVVFRAPRELTDEEREEIRERLVAGRIAKEKAAAKAAKAKKPTKKAAEEEEEGEEEEETPKPAKKVAKPATKKSKAAEDEDEEETTADGEDEDAELDDDDDEEEAPKKPAKKSKK